MCYKVSGGYSRHLFFLFFFFWISARAAWADLPPASSSFRTIVEFKRIGLPFYSSNEVKILPTGEIKFQDLFQAISEAKEYVYLDYFKFQQDSICNELFGLLKKKTAQGVDVRVIFDSFGNKNSDIPMKRNHLDSLRACGMSIVEFDRVRFPWIHHFFHRNHHKIAIVDGLYAYSGGMNVADYYLHGKPRVGEWRDMHMKVKGPAVEGYLKIFGDMWYRVTNERLPQTVAAKDAVSGEGEALIALADRVPRISPEIMRQVYTISIDNADSLVQIVNPYATLVKSVRKSIHRALKRGVKVQIMVSSRGDGPVTPDVVGIEMLKLMRRGAEILYYEGGFHHSKFMMIDGAFCTIGTTNLDARSLKYDYEVNAIMFDRTVTAELQRIFNRDAETRCTPMTQNNWKKRLPLGKRMSGRFFEMIKGVL